MLSQDSDLLSYFGSACKERIDLLCFILLFFSVSLEAHRIACVYKKIINECIPELVAAVCARCMTALGPLDEDPNEEVSDAMMENILDRTHLANGAPLPYPETGHGYEVVQQYPVTTGTTSSNNQDGDDIGIVPDSQDGWDIGIVPDSQDGCEMT